MKTVLFYYSGTGNSLWSAQQMANELGDCEIISMAQVRVDELYVDADNVGLFFPVHMWGVPRAVLTFVQQLKIKTAQYYFAMAINAGQVSRTLIQLKNLIEKKGGVLSGGLDIIMPTNYIPWGGPGSEKHQNERYQVAQEKIKRVAGVIQSNKTFEIEKGPLWQRILFSWIYRLSFAQVLVMDKSFWVDEKCNQCGICQKVCPAQNIDLVQGKPAWKHQCQQCLACIQWCPQEAIQYGKKTATTQRYHQKQITLAQMISGIPKK